MNNDGFYGRAAGRDPPRPLRRPGPRRGPGARRRCSSAAGSPTGTVTDLGCGSGILARVMSDLGYDVLGVDISARHARARRSATRPRATFRNESLVDASIPPSVAVTAIGEALNYATDPRAGLDATTTVARRVYDALAPGGVFLFDVATPGRNLGHGRPRAHPRRRRLDADACGPTETGDRLDRRITIYTREPDGRYTRIDEHHVIHLYDPDALRGAARPTSASRSRRARATARRGRTRLPRSGWTVFVATKPTR